MLIISALDDGVDLFVWGNAESAVTIVAASIPTLRVLIREVKSSATRYYNTMNESTSTRLSKIRHPRSPTDSEESPIIPALPIESLKRNERSAASNYS
jgi:hypothetical protein